MRLGVMGGTFDPVHNGHLRVARAAARRDLDRVALVPVHRPPHKDRGDITDPFHRFAMCALATMSDEKLAVSAFEVARAGPSYTIETVRHFVTAGWQVTLIMGSDSLAEVHTWRECEALTELSRVLVYPRAPQGSPDLMDRLPAWARRKWESGSIAWMDEPTEEISSSEVRKLIKDGRSIASHVPAAVAEYIIKHHLYVEEPGGGAD